LKRSRSHRSGLGHRHSQALRRDMVTVPAATASAST
jgi:hypothetical protein